MADRIAIGFGFALIALSALIGISTALYAHSVGGFTYWDPTLMKIYRAGILTSAGGLAISGFGIPRAHRFRGIAQLASAGCLFFWIASAVGE